MPDGRPSPRLITITVLDYIVDPHNLPEWQPDVIHIIADAPRAVAAGFR